MELSANILLIWILLLLAVFLPTAYLLVIRKMSRFWATVALMWFGFGSYLMVETVMSYPKPIQLEMFPAEEYQVIAFVIKPGEALYVYLDAGSGAPRSYSLKWGKRAKKLAHELTVGRAQAKAHKGTLYYMPGLGSDGVEARYPKPPGHKTEGTR